MKEVFYLAPALAAGLLLGVLFFGGLCWTINRGMSSRRPALWFVASMVLRTSIVLAGFCFIGREDWQRWLLCLFGFVLARLGVKWLTHWDVENHDAGETVTHYAP